MPTTELAALVRPSEAPTGHRRGVASLLVATVRPYQWVKNVFVLAPLLFGLKLDDPTAVAQALLAFAGFCLTASAIYLINDILDAPRDRAHPTKRRRPIASGALPVAWAWATVAGMGVAVAALVRYLGSAAAILLLAYGGLMVGYCIVLKRVPLVDCLVIAIGFVLRVACGAAAVGVQASHWLIACTFLLALFLAFAKRRQELVALATSAAAHRPVLNGYSLPFLDQVNTLLGGATLVCYILYTVAPETVARFRTDALIYGAGFVVYGLLRYLALVQTTTAGDDPSRAVCRDRPLQAAVLGWIGYNAAVIYLPALVSAWWPLPS